MGIFLSENLVYNSIGIIFKHRFQFYLNKIIDLVSVLLKNKNNESKNKLLLVYLLYKLKIVLIFVLLFSNKINSVNDSIKTKE